MGPETRLYLKLNAHVLRGEKREGRWSFTCDSWPALAEKYRGVADTTAIVAEFCARALADQVQVREVGGGT